MANEDKKAKPTVAEPDDEVDEQDETDEPDEMDEIDEIDELEEEILDLKARITELEEELAEKRPELSSTARWASWILGGLVGATCLALIVMFLGGGYPQPCECPEGGGAAGGDGPGLREQQQQQEALERLLRANSGDFQDCFESWASARESEIPPGWAVIVRLEIAADDDGNVQNVDATGNNLPEVLAQCLEEKVQRWTFPGPGPFTMELPFAVEGNATPNGSDAAPTSDGGPVTTDGAPATTDAS